ncbi:MAG TPA: hypothetical protein VFW76_12715 [Ktedonobacterales bacterium]|nr:hypothetical protein [Ktedonobacterales bacterium]
MIDWGALLIPAAVLLVVPLAIIVGYRRSTGSIVISGALAAGAFAVFWLILGGVDGLFGPSYPYRIISLYGGVLMTLSAWALSLNAAAQARRWVWVGILLVAGYCTLAAIYASLSVQPCFDGVDGEFACPSPDTLRHVLMFLGYLACPFVALAYGVYGERAHPFGRRVRTLPDGLTVSSLRAEPVTDAPRAEDAESVG